MLLPRSRYPRQRYSLLYVFRDNAVRSNCVSHVLISSYIYRFVLMEKRDNQNESTNHHHSVCVWRSRCFAESRTCFAHDWASLWTGWVCVYTGIQTASSSSQHFAERDGGNELEVLPFKDPADILCLWRGDPTSRNSVLLLASTQAWPQVSRTFTVACFCFYCRLDPLPRDHWLFTTSDAQVSDRSLSWREVLYYHAFRQRAQGKPLKAWRQRVHEKQQDGVIFGPLP